MARQCEISGLPMLVRFPALREALVSCVHEMLQRRLGPTKVMVQNLVNVELSYINTNHPDFVGGKYVLCAHECRLYFFILFVLQLVLSSFVPAYSFLAHNIFC